MFVLDVYSLLWDPGSACVAGAASCACTHKWVWNISGNWLWNMSGCLVQNYVRRNQWPFWLSWGLSLVAIIALGCSRTLRYKVPYNYMFLVRSAALIPLHPSHEMAF